MKDDNGWATKLAFALLMAGVLGWANGIQSTVSKVTGLEPQIEQMQREQERHAEWIATWPTEGELAADVRQTANIEFLFREMADLEESIDKLREAMEADG